MLTIAVGPYAHTAPLGDGRVEIDRAVRFELLPVDELFRRADSGEFDAMEMSLGSFVRRLGEGAPFVGVPVFPYRSFRQHAVLVRKGSGIRAPKDLTGGVIGMHQYESSNAVWLRGILQERHGLAEASVRYLVGGLEVPSRPAAIPDVCSREISPLDEGETLLGLLEGGAVDAVYAHYMPPFVDSESSPFRPLWRDSRAVEEAYLRDTGIFPILHVLVVRRKAYEREVSLPSLLLSAFSQAKDIAFPGLESSPTFGTLPSENRDLAATRALMGTDSWPYGLGPNIATLRTFLGYMHVQGLVDRLWEPESIFKVS